MQPGQLLTLTIEKPAAGGRMIARVDGRVVLVGGAVPGERVSARVERVGKGVVYAATVDVLKPSADRCAPPADPLCGGCLYAHIAYARQLEIKSLVIADAFTRLARLPQGSPVAVTPSPAEGYRMRARFHRRGSRLGFYKEGTHEICDARLTRQLLPATCDVVDRLSVALETLDAGEVSEVEISENVDASERVVHLHGLAARLPVQNLATVDGLTGVTASTSAGGRVLKGSGYVTDRLRFDEQTELQIRRHVLAFFQGNRFLVRDLVGEVAALVPEGGRVLDLYAGGGLFSVAAVRLRQSRVMAVEGDAVAADDLAANAAMTNGLVTARHEPVESYVRGSRDSFDAIVVDPPRTGVSAEALEGIIRLGAARLIYVSCDVATLARDARRLVDGGYEVALMRAFDLFPNTPHIETVAVFTLTFPQPRGTLRTTP